MAAQLADLTPVLVIGVIVTGERGNTHVGCRPTSVMTPSAGVAAQVPLTEAGLVIARIPTPPQ